MMHFLRILPILFVIVMIGFLVSCEDDKTTNPQNQAPTVPPQSSFVIDFNEFPDTASLEKADNPILVKRNWGWAAGNVHYWNSVLTVTLAIPVAAFLESFNHQPIQQSDGSWLWSYSITQQEPIFTAKLYGKTVAEGVEWRMLITKDGEYTDFEWFTGFSNLPVTQGTWTLNKEPNSPSPFLFIEWHRNQHDGTADVKYLLISPTTPADSSFIFYGKTNEVLFNRFYQIYNAESSNMIDINWNYEQYFGRVKDPVYFVDQNWHCWDEKLDDKDCTE